MQQFLPVDAGAWVITGYPRYAPQIVDIVTMDDLVYDVAVRTGNYAPEIYLKWEIQQRLLPLLLARYLACSAAPVQLPIRIRY